MEPKSTKRGVKERVPNNPPTLRVCVLDPLRFTSPPTPPPPWPPGAALQKPLFFSRFSRENALNAYAEGSPGGLRGGCPRGHFGIHYNPLGLFGVPLGAPLGVKHKKALFFSRISRENASSGVPSGPWGCPWGFVGVHLLSVGSLRVSSPFWLGLPLGASLGAPFWVPFLGSLLNSLLNGGPKGPPQGALPQGGPSDCIRV